MPLLVFVKGPNPNMRPVGLCHGKISRFLTFFSPAAVASDNDAVEQAGARAVPGYFFASPPRC